MLYCQQAGEGNTRVCPSLWHWPYSVSKVLQCALGRQQHVVLGLLLLATAPKSDSSSSLSKGCILGGQRGPFALPWWQPEIQLAGAALSYIALAHSPALGAAVFYQSSSPWCFSKAFAHTEARVAVTWVLILPKPVVLQRNKSKHLSWTVLVQLPMIVFNFLPVN